MLPDPFDHLAGLTAVELACPSAKAAEAIAWLQEGVAWPDKYTKATCGQERGRSVGGCRTSTRLVRSQIPSVSATMMAASRRRRNADRTRPKRSRRSRADMRIQALFAG